MNATVMQKVCGTLLLPALVFAQSTATDTIKILQVVEVVGDKDLSESKSLLLTSERLTREAKVSFMSALENLPGMAVIHTGVGIAKPVIRGMSFNRLVVSENGIQQQGQQWGSDHGLEIDVFGVEKVRITKGPMALVYGSDAIAGAIEILPEQPGIDKLKITTISGYQHNNSLYTSSWAVESTQNSYFAKARLTIQNFGDYRVPADRFIYNGYVLPIYQGYLKNTAGSELNGRLVVGKLTKKQNISLLWSSFNQRAGIFGGAVGSPRSYSLRPDHRRNIELPRQIITHNKLILNYKRFFASKILSLDIGWQFNRRREESQPHAHGRVALDKSNILALGLDLQSVMTTAKCEAKTPKGVEYAIGFSAQALANQISGYEFFIPAYRLAQAGFFATVEKSLKQGLVLSGGVRADIARFRSDCHRDSFYEQLSDRSERMIAISRNFFNWVGSCGVVWLPKSWLSIKGNTGRVFRVPTPNELASNGVHHGTFRHEMGRPTLRSETGYALDLDISVQTKNLQASFSPYHYFFDNYLYMSPSAQFSPLPEAGQIYQHQQDKARLYGFEIQANLMISKPINWETHFSYVRGTNLTTRLPLPFMPPDRWYSRLTWHKRWAKWRFLLFAEVVHAWAQTRTDRNEKATPAYWLLGAGGELKYQEVTLSVGIQNIADVAYLQHLSRYRLLGIVEPGRNFRLILRVPIAIIKSGN